MILDTRRNAILEAIIRAYIQDGTPVSSQEIAEHLSFSVSSATVRNEMAALEDDGYLRQPHVSAGRFPTALAFRFIVSQILAEREIETLRSAERAVEDTARTAQRIAHDSGAATFAASGGAFSFAGFEFMLSAPELREEGALDALARLLDASTRWENLLRNALRGPIGVFIAEENPIVACTYFSMVAARLPNRGIVAILGPLRLDYARAIRTLAGFLRAS